MFHLLHPVSCLLFPLFRIPCPSPYILCPLLHVIHSYIASPKLHVLCPWWHPMSRDLCSASYFPHPSNHSIHPVSYVRFHHLMSCYILHPISHILCPTLPTLYVPNSTLHITCPTFWPRICIERRNLWNKSILSLKFIHSEVIYLPDVFNEPKLNWINITLLNNVT